MNTEQEKIVNQFKIDNAEYLKHYPSELIEELKNSIDRGNNHLKIKRGNISEPFLSKLDELYNLLKLTQ